VTLSWRQPDLGKPCHLLEDDQRATVARLDFQQQPGVVWNARNPQRADGQAGGSRWTFTIQRSGVSGLLGLSATVLIEGSQSGQVVTGANFVNGKVTLAGAPDMEWRSSATRPGGSRFTSSDGTLLVHFLAGSIADRINTIVEIAPPAMDRPERWLLSTLGLYLRVVGRRPFR
jgi:hypothetical protein